MMFCFLFSLITLFVTPSVRPSATSTAHVEEMTLEKALEILVGMKQDKEWQKQTDGTFWTQLIDEEKKACNHLLDYIKTQIFLRLTAVSKTDVSQKEKLLSLISSQHSNAHFSLHHGRNISPDISYIEKNIENGWLRFDQLEFFEKEFERTNSLQQEKKLKEEVEQIIKTFQKNSSSPSFSFHSFFLKTPKAASSFHDIFWKTFCPNSYVALGNDIKVVSAAVLSYIFYRSYSAGAAKLRREFLLLNREGLCEYWRTASPAEKIECVRLLVGCGTGGLGALYGVSLLLSFGQAAFRLAPSSPL